MIHHRAVSMSVGATLMLAAATLPSPAAAQRSIESEYQGIGEAATRIPCDFDRSWWNFDSCEGFAKFSPFDPGRRFDTGEWIQSRKWDKLSVNVTKEGGLAIRLAMISNPRDMPLKQLDRRGTVVARLQADPEGPADELYKIGGAYTSGQRFTGDFFIIIDRYRAVIDDGDGESRKIANWRLYGLRSTGELVAMPANGAFRFCKMSRHSASLTAPIFASCATRHELGQQVKQYGQQPLLQALERHSAMRARGQSTVQLLAAYDAKLDTIFNRIYGESARFGVSLPCGVGCCITEFGFDLPDGAAFAAHVRPDQLTALTP